MMMMLMNISMAEDGDKILIALLPIPLYALAERPLDLWFHLFPKHLSFVDVFSHLQLTPHFQPCYEIAPYSPSPSARGVSSCATAAASARQSTGMLGATNGCASQFTYRLAAI